MREMRRQITSRLERLILTYCIAMCVLYALVAVHTPMTMLAYAPHDDGLFIKLGQYLSEGQWLGPYDSYTLMKGPGYPGFLAVSNWLGLPISLTHALFHCAAVLLVGFVAFSYTRSLLLSGMLFTLLLWHPFTLGEFRHVLREQIYPGQALIVFAATTMALIVSRRTAQVGWAVLAGTCLGWFWLTREEGVWLLPTIGTLAAVAVLHALKAGRFRAFGAAVLPLLIMIGIFATIQIGFRVANWAAYGKFVGLEVNEANFQRAMTALQSVRSGGVKPFVSITREGRESVYAISPAFASLRTYLETDGPMLGKVEGCQMYPESCGEMHAGWFLWILRAAAEADGHIKSPAAAADFFGELADEVDTACDRGVLKCDAGPIALAPPFAWGDAFGAMPAAYAKAIRTLIPGSSTIVGASVGDDGMIESELRFLHYPGYVASAKSRYTFFGWYRRVGQEWITADTTWPDGTSAGTDVERLASPDLISAFKDPLSVRQRFAIRSNCSDDCVFHIEAADGDTVERRFGDMMTAPFKLEIDGGTFYVDSASSSPVSSATAADQLLSRVRASALSVYIWIWAPFVCLGLLSFILSTVLYLRMVLWNLIYGIAVASWVAVASHITLLAFIEATSFPAIDGNYLAPSHFFILCGAMFSMAALWRLSTAPRDHGSRSALLRRLIMRPAPPKATNGNMRHGTVGQNGDASVGGHEILPSDGHEN
jgi:hypothetical protein